ncbi:cardiolipin synthase [Bacillus sp. FJAT-45350]|uniref:cardiolipin synthase n=1 Tax=Bacillus sp. FJAT-45350 TaxID=2011014 RepID=UPI000BB6D838|nr:cardiolipin synthase [Bacillus sp. FJAT-45350]
MIPLLITISILILIVLWCRIDFKLGMKVQKNEARKRIQETRYGTVKFLPTGDQLFENMFQDIKQATSHIHVLFYIVKEDSISTKFLNLLMDKAKEGLEVRLLIDRIGSQVSRKKRKELQAAGVQFAFSHPAKFPYIFFTLNRRNHRKITIVDGNIGYIGGFNVGDEYLGRDPKFGYWRDYHLRLDGDGVQDIQEQFVQDWKVGAKQQLSSERYFPKLRQGKVPLRILPTDGVYLEDTFIDLIRQAKQTITIGTPYFIPGTSIQGELIRAAKRGIFVRIIVPKKGDHPLVKEAAFPYFQDLLESGCEIYRYYRGFYHAKALIIDDQVCDIGTANFDKRSFHIDHEINCLMYGPEFIQIVKQEMDYDISISERLTVKDLESRSLFHRGKERVATLISGLL